MSSEDLNTTSYAVLGLLSLRPWPAYELAAEMQHCFGPYWPRAESRSYEQAERLVSAGLAEKVEEKRGRRKRTTYSITDAGRAALKTWLSLPSAMFVLEFEGLVKVFLARAGDKAQLLANLTQIERTADMMLAVADQRRRYCVEGNDPWCRQEGHVRALVGDFLAEHFTTVRRWARRSHERVSAWPDLAPQSDVVAAWRSMRIEPTREALEAFESQD
jgi:DNA-binding PadR family transcriptional regulator